MPQHIFFWVGLSCILVHEMDAVRLKEWQMFPILSQMNDEAAYVTFTVIHIPLYVLLGWALLGRENETLILWLNAFFVVHLFLHLLLVRHRYNRFKSLFSWSVIGVTAVCGLIDFARTLF